MTTSPRVSRVWAEHRGIPEFLGTATPRLSWQVSDAPQGWGQSRATIECDRGGEPLVASVAGSASQLVPWPFEPLAAYESVRIRVTVADDGADGAPSDWLHLRTGPLTSADLTAALVATPGPITDDRPTHRFRTVFTIDGDVQEAVLSATAHGVYEPVLNGTLVGDEVLAPGWTAYDQRLLVQSFDVTPLLEDGANVLGATVAEGWYRERFGFDGRFAVAYDGPVALWMQLRIRFADGRIQQVSTGDDWQVTDAGPTRSASIYQGEVFDARAVDAALADAEVPLPGAQPVSVLPMDVAVLQVAATPPVRRIETRAVQSVLTTPDGRTVLDFGQNLVGWVEFDTTAEEGTEIVLRHAEVLDHGEIATRPLRFAAATDRYVAAGRPATWSPRFTFHGFRYAEVTGWPGVLDPAAFRAVVVHSDLESTGTLEVSDPRLNQLLSNVRWGMRGNFLSIPTDCPQRDERLGWTGDIQVFAPTAGYLYDTTAFLGSWLRDLAIEQHASGGVVPMVVPNPVGRGVPPAAAWGDAGALVPEAVWRQSADLGVLEQQYSSMKAWVEVELGRIGDDLLWTGGFQFGDWLDPSAPPENPAAAKTDPDIVASAYVHRSTKALAAAAAALGLADESAHYAAIAERIRRAFVREYVTPAGKLMSDSHTAYSLAVAFGLLTDPDQLQAAGDRLAMLVRAYGYRIRTGFVGTPIICDALTATGHVDVAYRLLLEDGNPSWLYPISMGATTVWERWDSMLPDGSINPGEMTSFNHYALGAVADWMHRVIGGIAIGEPGYRLVEIAPVPGGGLTSATAALHTGYGLVSSSWTLDDGWFTLDVVVPVGATARVTVPGGVPVVVEHGAHRFETVLPSSTSAVPPVGLDSRLSDIVDQPAVRATIEAFFAEIGYFIGLGWSTGGRWRPDSVLRDSLIMFPEEQLPRLEAALASARHG